MIDQIINLKEKAGITEQDATLVNQHTWYEYALKQGLVETVVENGKLLGFIEWVRGYLENNLFIAPPKTIKTAPILWITNCVATDMGIIWKLSEKVTIKNIDCKKICWHNKNKNKWFEIKNIRRSYA